VIEVATTTNDASNWESERREVAEHWSYCDDAASPNGL